MQLHHERGKLQGIQLMYMAGLLTFQNENRLGSAVGLQTGDAATGHLFTRLCVQKHREVDDCNWMCSYHTILSDRRTVCSKGLQ